MFEALTGRLRSVFDALQAKGALGEGDVDRAMRDIRRALLEADVALPVVRELTEGIRARAVGREVLASVTPAQQVTAIVREALEEALGESVEPRLVGRPATVLLVGLQGSGKTTTAAKIGRRYATEQGRRVLLASLDTRRPAAMEQLATLGGRAGLEVLDRRDGEDPVAIARRALDRARRDVDLLLLDSAGRSTVDAELMAECAAIRDAVEPQAIWLVADSLAGQSAADVARGFQDALDLSGVVLTRLDGDGRGGAALSMRAVSGQPILFAGTGEGIEDLEPFHPGRVATRILGMGDVTTLVEKARELVDEKEAEKSIRRMARGRYDLDDYRREIERMRKLGGMGRIMEMLPGSPASTLPPGGEAELDAHLAIIQSMTRRERSEPGVIKGSRRRRIAAGAGVAVDRVNRLLKAHRQMESAARMIGSAAGGGRQPDMRQMMAQLSRRSSARGRSRRSRRW